MPPPEVRNPVIIDLEKMKLDEAQEKDFKTAIVNMLKDFNADMNKCLNEDKQLNEILQTI